MLKARVPEDSGTSGDSQAQQTGQAYVLDWIKVVGPIVVSWPVVALITMLLFHGQVGMLFHRFTEGESGKATIGPVAIELGRPVVPPQYRSKVEVAPQKRIDLSDEIGAIRDSGPEGTTVGIALAYAIQAALKEERGVETEVSARGIYVLARERDEWSDDGDGTSIEAAIEATREIGAFAERDWPYARKSRPATNLRPIAKVTSSEKLSGIAEILSALQRGHVVVVITLVTSDFDDPEPDGTVTLRLPVSSMGSKAIVIVGYDGGSAKFQFANDWGTQWGSGGFGRVKDADLSRLMLSAYVVNVAKAR